MSVSELVQCAHAIVGGDLRKDYGFAIRQGAIVEAGNFRDIRDRAADLPTRSFPADRLIVPGFINGHSHAYQILLRGWADDWTFQRWRSEALYRVIPFLTAEDVYWTFVAAFSEMLGAGITTVAEFFYLNGEGNERAEAAIRAAADTGIRLIFARTWMDVETAPSQFRESIDVAAARTLELAKRFPEGNVCVAPHSLHAASPAMIRAAAEFAREHDCMMHVHVAEAAYEGERTLAEYGATPVTLLDRWNALDERTVAVHAIYISEEEKDLLGRSGARVVHNPMTNQYLGDGICDVTGLRARGVQIALGTDADVKPSLIDEMRSASLLQKILHTDGSALGADAAFAMGTREGASALRMATGDLVAGNLADYVVMDASRIDPWAPASNGVVYRGEDRWVQGTFVGGKRAYTGGDSELTVQAKRYVPSIVPRIAG